MTEHQLKLLVAAGKVKVREVPKGLGKAGFQQPPGRRIAKVKACRIHPQKAWIAQQLLEWCQNRAIILWEEYRFHPTRKWRFDWCIPDRKIAVEYEGLGFKKTGHTESDRYSGNTDKYNAAAVLGWTVFRVTYLNYGTLMKTITDFENSKNQNDGSKSS